MAWYGVILLSSRLSLWDNAKENHLITGFCSTMLPSLLSQLLSQGLQGCLSVVPYAVRFAGQNVWELRHSACGRDLIISSCFFSLHDVNKWKSGTPKLSQPVSHPLCRLSSQAPPKTAMSRASIRGSREVAAKTDTGQLQTLQYALQHNGVNICEHPPGSWEWNSNGATGSFEFAMSPCRLLTLRTFVILC